MLLNSFSTWWQGLELLSKIYWLITIPISTLFVIELVMTFFGASSETGEFDETDDADISFDIDEAISFQLITLKNLVAFFTLFGWIGLACIDSQLSTATTVIISTICGFLMMVLMASIYYFTGRLSENGNIEINRAIGVKATVYLPIPPKREAAGKIQIKLQGLRILNVLTDEEETIPTGSLCEVVGILSEEILLVKKL